MRLQIFKFSIAIAITILKYIIFKSALWAIATTRLRIINAYAAWLYEFQYYYYHYHVYYHKSRNSHPHPSRIFPITRKCSKEIEWCQESESEQRNQSCRADDEIAPWWNPLLEQPMPCGFASRFKTLHPRGEQDCKEQLQKVSMSQMKPIRQVSECDSWSDGAGHQWPGYVFLNRKLGPPARTVTRHEHGGIEPFEIGDGALDLVRVACGEMEPTDDGMDGYWSTGEFDGMFGGVDYASVATSSEDNETFP